MKILLAIFLLHFSPFVNAQDTTKPSKKVAYPKGYTEQLNVVYKTVGDWQGLMDVYLPPAKSGPVPLLINIHGGGWNTGSKEMDNFFGSYFKKGYAVANIDYRLAGTASAPAAIEDARCALIYLINHAKEFNINTDKIILCGTSAGGHLALLAGFLGNNSIFDADCKPSTSFKIAAIIDKSGISDVLEWGFGAKGPGNTAVKRWLGAAHEKDTALARKLSPLTYLTKDSPPVFILHGDADPIVPYSHSTSLKEMLDAVGVKNDFLSIPGGKHGNFGSENNKLINERFVAFLEGLGL